MPHTYVSDLVHCVFSNKQRKKMIPAAMQSELWSFIGGIARSERLQSPDCRRN
jgi:hypothetical protein